MKCYVKHNTTKKRGFKNKMRRIVKNASDHETHIVSTEIQVNAIFNSLKMNYLFYIMIIVCICIINKLSYNSPNILLSLLTIIPISLFGYAIHYISHKMKNKLSKQYLKYDNIFTRNRICNCIFTYIIRVAEFHDAVHHDTSINKKFTNILLEIMNNILLQGVIIIILKKFVNLMDDKIILLWALFYSTVHNINFNITHPITHVEHHMNNNTNYGLDLWDILIGSKYDWTHIENHNDTIINLIVITIIIVYISNYLKM